MVTFVLIVSPLPHKVRAKVFTFLSESPIVGKIAYGLKITFMFVFFASHLFEDLRSALLCLGL